jgi:hypothetical protein
MRIWIQYGYDDPADAPVFQSLEGYEDDAREADDDFAGCCWYSYKPVNGQLVDPDGPFYFWI